MLQLSYTARDLVLYCRFQFIPQLIFLNSLFGYLSLLVIVKWCTGSQADLYHVMIYMFLSPTDDLGENQLFPGQRLLQVCLYPAMLYCAIDKSGKHHLLILPSYQLVLLALALIAVPWMLFPKPFLLKKQHEEVCLFCL